jgi:hypothetical protein
MSIEPYHGNPVARWTRHGEAVTLGATALGALAIGAATATTLWRRTRRSRHPHPVPVATPRAYRVSVTVVEAWFSPIDGR